MKAAQSTPKRLAHVKMLRYLASQATQTTSSCDGNAAQCYVLQHTMADLLEAASLTVLAVVQLAISMLSRPFHILQACCGTLCALGRLAAQRTLT